MFKNEYDIIKAAQSGDNAAKEQLFENYNKLIIMIANKTKSYTTDFEELYQCGCVGFVKALNNFDIEKGYRFTTYVYPLVDFEIKKFLRDHRGLIKHDKAKTGTFKKIYKMEIREYTKGEISKELKISYSEIEELKEEFSYDIIPSLDNTINCLDKNITYLEQLKEEKYSSEVFENEIYIRECINQLNNRQKEIIIRYFFKDQSQTEISKTIGISQISVSRNIKKALKILKEYMRKDGEYEA